MINERRTLIRVADQHAEVRNMATGRDYKKQYQKYFSDLAWISTFEQGLLDPRVDAQPELFRFQGVLAMLAAQYGFDSLEALGKRHKKSGMGGPLLDPRYGLMMCVYLANANVQSYPIKEEIINELEDPALAPGIWGRMLPISKGIVRRNIEAPTSTLLRARIRMRNSRAIPAPDRDFNRGLAMVDFGPKNAGMSKEEFSTQVFPEVAPLLRPLMDPEVIFSQPKAA